MFDWMHDTARCLGYPSDSSRAARDAAGAGSGDILRPPSAPGRPGAAGLDTASSGLCGLAPRPRGLPLRPCGSPLLSPGWRRAVPTSHWPWVSSRAARRRAGSPARIATALYVGVQWGGLGLARLRVDRRQRRVLWGSGASGAGLCIWEFINSQWLQ